MEVALQVQAHGTLDPATHAYSFWEGVPASARRSFGALFAQSSSLQCVAVVQRAVRTCPPEFMAAYGFGDLRLVATVPNVRMSGASWGLLPRAGSVGALCVPLEPAALYWCTRALPVAVCGRSSRLTPGASAAAHLTCATWRQTPLATRRLSYTWT